VFIFLFAERAQCTFCMQEDEQWTETRGRESRWLTVMLVAVPGDISVAVAENPGGAAVFLLLPRAEAPTSGFFPFLVCFCSTLCHCLRFVPLVPVSSLLLVCFTSVSLLSLSPLFAPVFLYFFFFIFLRFLPSSSSVPLCILLYYSSVFFFLLLPTFSPVLFLTHGHSLSFSPLLFGPSSGFYSQRMQAFSVTVGVHHGGEEHHPRDVPTLDCSSTVSEKKRLPCLFIASPFFKKTMNSARNP